MLLGIIQRYKLAKKNKAVVTANDKRKNFVAK